MGPRAWISAFVVVALAGPAYGQPWGPQAPSPPAADATTAAPAPDSAPPAAGTPPPYAPPAPPYPPPPPYPAPPPYVAAPQPPAPPPPQQVLCISGRPFECASTFLLEVGVRGAPNRAVTSAGAGLLIHDGFNAYGATVGVLGVDGANAKNEANLWFAARYRRYLGTWGFAADVSAGYAGGPALEVAIGWADVVALTAGVNGYALEEGGRETIATAGFRAGTVIIGGLFYVSALVFASAR